MAIKNSDSQPSVAEIQAQCARILGSTGFARSGRQRAFLEFIVNATIEGRSDRLKEFTLGIEVFDKDESFDPSIDAIVRVEASRLRSKLTEYYVNEGQADSIRINVPKGHYVPEFVRTAPQSLERKSPDRWRRWVVVTSVALIIMLLFYNFVLPKEPLPTVAINSELTNPSSVAVLPLRDWSGTPERYFSEAVTDALISSLAELGPLRVTSLTSVRQFAETEISTREISRALGVAYIVDGNITRNDEQVKITTHLIEASSEAQIWSRTFEHPLADLVNMHNGIAVEIAAHISNDVKASTSPDFIDLNPVAYEAYLKGRYFYNQFSADGFQRSIEFYQQAIRIEPDYAEAYAGLASCHCLLAGHGLELVAPVIAIPEAHSLAMKALSLNPDMAEPVAFLGIISFKFGWDVEAAVAQLERAAELNPSLFQAYVWYSQVLEAMGRNDEAVAKARDAKRLNPLSLAVSLNLGWQLYQSGKYLEASAEADKLVAFNSDFWGGHWIKGHLYNKHKMYDKAMDEFRLAVELEGGHSLPLSALGYTYALAGMTDEAFSVIKNLETLSKSVYVSPFHMATIYAGLNQPDEMFEWLERAFVVRARSLAWMQVTTELLPFAEDARFQNLLQRIGVAATHGIATQSRDRI